MDTSLPFQHHHFQGGHQEQAQPPEQETTIVYNTQVTDVNINTNVDAIQYHRHR